MNFDKSCEQRQLKWRKQNISNNEMGVQNGLKRPWILPQNNWKDGLFLQIRDSLPVYLEENDVQPHKGVHNLKSSWILCANLYFPFRNDTQILADFLHNQICPKIETVNRIELEYAETGDFQPSRLLGEPQGTRGANQTSPDVAFIVNEGQGLILTENKYTEHSFYPCSGRKSQYNNPDIGRCLDIDKLLNDTRQNCYMCHWQNETRSNRKYWNFIDISEHGRKILTQCPAATHGYQLFRQQALAEGFAQGGKYKFVMSCVAYDENNETLLHCLRSTGIDDFRNGWQKIFNGKTQFASFSHQQWVNWVRQHDTKNKWQQWLKYVNERYGY